MSSTGFATRGLPMRRRYEEALDGEVADALGRERYEGEKGGYRNGYRTGKVKTAETESGPPAQQPGRHLGWRRIPS